MSWFKKAAAAVGVDPMTALEQSASELPAHLQAPLCVLTPCFGKRHIFLTTTETTPCYCAPHPQHPALATPITCCLRTHSAQRITTVSRTWEHPAVPRVARLLESVRRGTLHCGRCAGLVGSFKLILGALPEAQKATVQALLTQLE